jgi:predicted nucleic acid-binding protein
VAVLIDTDMLIAMERQSRGGAPYSPPGDPNEPAAIAAITASELFLGVHRAQTDTQRTRRRAFVETILARIPVVPFDLLCARAHADIAAGLIRTGAAIGPHDLLIAATAVAHGFILFTGNVAEFQKVPGLRVMG